MLPKPSGDRRGQDSTEPLSACVLSWLVLDFRSRPCALRLLTQAIDPPENLLRLINVASFDGIFEIDELVCQLERHCLVEIGLTVGSRRSVFLYEDLLQSVDILHGELFIAFDGERLDE